jgi:hypothetical protein
LALVAMVPLAPWAFGVVVAVAGVHMLSQLQPRLGLLERQYSSKSERLVEQPALALPQPRILGFGKTPSASPLAAVPLLRAPVDRPEPPVTLFLISTPTKPVLVEVLQQPQPRVEEAAVVQPAQLEQVQVAELDLLALAVQVAMPMVARAALAEQVVVELVATVRNGEV